MSFETMQRDRSYRVMRHVVRVAGAVGVGLFVLSGSLAGAVSPRHLEPSPLGQGQCQASGFKDGSVDGQIAVSSASCSVASTVEAGSDHASGSTYHDDGFTCTATKEGAHSPWAAAWGSTYYAYSCVAGARQVAFNWGQDYVFGASATRLKPSPLGSGECQASAFPDKSVDAQIAVYRVSCSEASAVEAGSDHARGATYHYGGFTCVAKTEGPGSTWASAWGGTYYAYSCVDGAEQVAFNWGTDYTY